MSNRFAAIKYKYEVKCPSCETVLAHRAQLSRVFDRHGHEVLVPSTGEDVALERYKISCECGHVLELESPSEVLPWSVFDDYECGGPPAMLLV